MQWRKTCICVVFLQHAVEHTVENRPQTPLSHVGYAGQTLLMVAKYVPAMV